MKILNRYRSPFDLLLPAGDAVLAVMVIGLHHSLLHGAGFPNHDRWAIWVIQGWTMAALVLMSFYFTDLYAVDARLSPEERQRRLLKGFGLVCLLIAAAGLRAPAPGFAEIYLLDLLLVGSALFVWHQRFALGLKNGPILSKLLIVGTEPIGRLVAEQVYLKKHLRMQVVGFIGERYDSITLSCGNPRNQFLCVFPRHEIITLVDNKRVDRILVTAPEMCGDFPAQDLLAIRLRGTQIEDCHSFCERVMSQIPITGLRPDWVVFADGFRRGLMSRALKRIVDVVLSAICLLLSAPLFVLTALAIKLDSPGPVFYSQERMGLDEKPFTLYKFRSMCDNAEADSGPVWAGSEDPRVTRVGKFMRRFRIDELPQLFNVLRGEMSLVGPRPERPFFIARFKESVPYYHLRFAVKPGITGWAQVSYPYAATDEDALEKLQYELYYIKNISPWLDLQILFLTLKIVLLGRGSQ